ncbi:MAG: hypothetical protein M5R41_03610 [Bacteroidia bacterium]|nr:hypothetical protein [Bacteroidia bacterium]
MTGFLVTVSLVCGCVLNSDGAFVETPNLTPVRSVVGSVVTALYEVGVRGDHSSAKLHAGIHAVLTLNDGVLGAWTSRSFADASCRGRSSAFYLTPPVRAPSFH